MFMLDNDLNDLDNAGWPKGYLCSIILTIQALHDRISAWSNVDAEQGREQVEACRERCRKLQGDAEICFVFA